MSDAEFVAAVTAAVIGAWGTVFGVISIVDFFRDIA